MLHWSLAIRSRLVAAAILLGSSACRVDRGEAMARPKASRSQALFLFKQGMAVPWVETCGGRRLSARGLGDGNRMNRPPDYPGVLCAVSRHPAHIVHISLVREQLACATSAGTANCQFLANVWRHLFFALFRRPLWPDAASCRSRALRDSHHIHSGRENWGFCSRLIGIRARCSRRRSGCSRWAEGCSRSRSSPSRVVWRDWLQRRRAATTYWNHEHRAQGAYTRKRRIRLALFLFSFSSSLS